ncbi:hemerythrin domain-containing protein [Streptomyces phaeochromogenes]|uniref:Hemerythrin domain-containing protein n=1 Tax=Streptomyces phaeochromogenes TaxID=1923 RepID=A0ABZ1HIV1_STRPH|nr:hemerythrin domain-containing protein [Streptomyces phaeochromogenes]WSD18140.1 hemerythrin domain-containing protein [Streptomyces phaeochromogenes]
MPVPQHIDSQAAGRQLLVGHRELRAQLAALRAALDEEGGLAAAVGGNGDGVSLVQQLRARCLEYCLGLHHHHTMEDGAFPVFEQRYPEIAPVIERLREEHRQVAAGLERLTKLVESDDGQDVNWLRGELERTVAGIEEHFVYEETYLLPALGVTPPGPSSS